MFEHGPDAARPRPRGCIAPAAAPRPAGALHEALAAFERLGAEPWAAAAHAELRATGGRVRAAGDGLTPAELRVASAVARGASNRQVAAELYLSPKTVEFHLGQVYRKLGIRSRAQLRRRAHS